MHSLLLLLLLLQMPASSLWLPHAAAGCHLQGAAG
jgi:hypothetical protein